MTLAVATIIDQKNLARQTVNPPSLAAQSDWRRHTGQ
jgi:hypothetical protein